MLFFIIFIGLVLRVGFINKPEGLWNDEYVSWFVANTPFNSGFWQEVFKQCHMPLYYLYLKPFSHCSDLILRLTSVLPGVLAIPVMYLAGKEFSKKAGLISAFITSILSFLVYYSQEVRFYSLLFLFSAISLLFTIRLIKNYNKKNLCGYIISLLLILFTHIIGVIYVFFNLTYLMYVRKRISKSWFLLLIPGFAALPFVIKMLPSSQWWGHFSYTNILFLFSDFFSPILTNNVNAPPVFFYNQSLAIWLLVPTLAAFTLIIAGFKKGLTAVAISTITVMSILAAAGKLVFITKYAMETLPILILMAALGVEKLKKTGLILLALLSVFHFAAIFTPHYVTKLPRKEGHRIAGEILKYQNSDNIVFTYYEPDRFYRYIELHKKNTYFISKINRFEYKDNPSRILENITPGETVSIVFLDSVSFLNEAFVAKNEKNPKIPEMFLTFSKIKNSLIKTLDSDFKDFQVNRAGSWTIIKARRFR